MSGARRWPAWASWPFVALIRAYQVTLSPFMGGHCRFHPTCSAYAVEAYRVHGPVRGTLLTAWRLMRCQPFGGKGYDPVPLPGERRRTDADGPAGGP